MATLRQSLTTTVGAHGAVAKVVVYGKRMGLDVTCDTAGGWWEKEHLITARGTDEQVRRFSDALQGYLRGLSSDG